MKSIVITGVSTGIGYEAAKMLVGQGWRVYGSVRKQADTDRLQQELGQGFTPLLFDVTDEGAIATAATQIPAPLTALINNAGIAEPAPLMHMLLADFRKHLEINVTGVLAVTQAFLPLLGAQANWPHPPGRIINISSVSGRIVYPFMGAYAASKHALEAMSDALRRELLLYGIDVILIEPGTVRTPIIGKFAGQVARYMETDYGRVLQPLAAQVEKREQSALPVERVTAVILQALESEHPKTRYPLPRKRLTGWLLPRLLPDRWFDRLVARQLKIGNQ
ncbi:MAG: SDR family oxidoreductase [Chloroflexi bacterium]|nr:SDR family oxidoreductase [Ardenticatenaceae bacterium]MBL1127627.1 SDR family oxidoreductase [Chloroflexota bacterium]NOG33692.1 SDR family oxidoreductase [Chloroflexota bacterium]GIK56012.1 MAG: oxidoreductase [Chloroflexota bacterium]